MKNVMIITLFTIAIVVSACATNSTPAEQVITQTGEIKEFTIAAYQFGFEPSNIDVKKGDRVKLTFISRDVDHGVYIPDFERSVPRFVQGEQKSVEFVANKTGTFPYMCSVFCGKGHREMKGTITVTE
jgi:cytochrome c oxidase subunit 2